MAASNNVRDAFCKNLRKYMRARDVDQAQIANALSVTASTVSDWVNGKKYPRIESMERLANFFGTTHAALTTLISPQPATHPNMLPITSRKVPLLGSIQCGAPTFAEEDFEGYVEIGDQIRADFALRARGDSMSGIGIQDGFLVFIRKQPAVNDGEVAAVLLDDDTTLKRVRYLPGGMTMLQAENPRYSPIVIGGEDEVRTVQVLGKAVAFIGDVV